MNQYEGQSLDLVLENAINTRIGIVDRVRKESATKRETRYGNRESSPKALSLTKNEFENMSGLAKVKIFLDYDPQHLDQNLHRTNILSSIISNKLQAALKSKAIVLVGGSASLISPITQSTIIFTIAINYFFLGERDNMLKKVMGAASIILGVILLI